MALLLHSSHYCVISFVHFMHDKSKQTSKIIIHTLSAFAHLPLHLCLRSISYSSNISSRFLKKDLKDFQGLEMFENAQQKWQL